MFDQTIIYIYFFKNPFYVHKFIYQDYGMFYTHIFYYNPNMEFYTSQLWSFDVAILIN